MDWIKEIFIGTVLLLFGWLLRLTNEKRKELDEKMEKIQTDFKTELKENRKENLQRFDAFRLQIRDDVQRLHAKIESGQSALNNKIDLNQRETQQSLQSILKELSK